MEVPTTMGLKVNQVVTLRLQSLGTSGYAWSSSIEGNAMVIEVKVDRANPPPQANAPMPFGSSLDEVFTIRGRVPGQVILHLVQRRAWETNQPPLKDYRIEVTVDAD